MSTNTTDSITDEYATWLRSWGASERTITARHGLARARLAEWGIDGMTAEHISDFLGRSTIKPWTRSTYHSNLTCFTAWLVAAGHLDANPMEGVRKPKRPAPRPRPLSEAEVARVLAAVDGEVRDWIRLALLSGLRASEIAKIRGEDVTGDGLYVVGKGNKAVTLPCHDEIWAMAERYPRKGYWFPGNDDGHMRAQQISLIVGKTFHAMGIEGSIHRCRHVYGTRLLRAGVHIRIVQKLMRHTNLDTTAAYTAVDEDELREAVNRLSA